MNNRRGRPAAGTSDARERLVTAAQKLFTAHGYAGATVRAIAGEAGCDPALVAYHFGSKAGLYAHVTTLLLDPATVLATALPGPREDIGPRLIAHVLHVWGRPEIRRPLAHLITTALADPHVMTAFREYLDREVMTPLVEYLHGPRATHQANALMTLVIGAIFGRFVVQIPTITQPSADDYLAALTPPARAATRSLPRP